MVGEIQGQRWRCCSSFGTRGTARSIVDWWATTYAIFSWGNGSLFERACSGCRRKRSHQLHDWDSEHNTDVEVVLSVSGARKPLVLLCEALDVNPSSFLTEDVVGKASVVATLTTVAERFALYRSDWKASLRVFSSLPLAIVKAWTAYVQSRQPDRHCKIADVGGELNPHWSQVTLDDDWCAVCE